MRRRRSVAAAAIVVAALAAWRLWPPEPAPPIVGVVRTTELHVAPEVGGRLVRILVRRGAAVRSGDIVAELSSPELEAALAEARASAAAARAARAQVYAGVRAERVAALARDVDKAESNRLLAAQQRARAVALAANGNAARQSVDQATADLATAQAAVAAARQRYAEAAAGATAEERTVADAQVAQADAATALLERRLEKTVLKAPADGVVGVIASEPGEAIAAGQTVLTVDAAAPWATFNLREDRLQGLGIGSPVRLAAGAATIAARITELRALGDFATWRAARAVGDHDLVTLELRVEPAATPAAPLEPGMTATLLPDLGP